MSIIAGQSYTMMDGGLFIEHDGRLNVFAQKVLVDVILLHIYSQLSQTYLEE